VAGDIPRLTRSRSNRLVAGVCGGMGRYFGIDPLVIRVVTVACAFAGGTGVAAYLAAWVLMPLASEEQEAEAEALAATRSARRDPKPRRHDLLEVVAVGSIALGVLLLLRAGGVWFNDVLVWPVLLAGAGMAVIWRQAGASDDRPALLRMVERPLDVRMGRAAWARVVVGVVLVVSGVAFFLAASDAFSAARDAVLGSAVIVAGLAFITGPWWVRLGRELTQERRERIRSEERAEVAAHLHDSVLQTLALIQRNADDPRAVVTMARRQERELRGWLYQHDHAAPDPGMVAAALTRAAEEVEGLHGVKLDVVAVGDCPLDDHLRALVAAAREAMVNAARWSGDTTVSVYTEVGDDDVAVFVRDWGVGFDADAVAADRHGVRESILGRMARHGGTAAIRSTPGEGTEIELHLPRHRQPTQ
jgi:signal transduction histidine kinase